MIESRLVTGCRFEGEITSRGKVGERKAQVEKESEVETEEGFRCDLLLMRR
jgi:hypothetical protein